MYNTSYLPLVNDMQLMRFAGADSLSVSSVCQQTVQPAQKMVMPISKVPTCSFQMTTSAGGRPIALQVQRAVLHNRHVCNTSTHLAGQHVKMCPTASPSHGLPMYFQMLCQMALAMHLAFYYSHLPCNIPVKDKTSQVP